MLATLRRWLTLTFLQTSAERTAMIEAYRRQRLQCIADLRNEAGISSPSEAVPATTTPRRTATWPLAGSRTQPAGVEGVCGADRPKLPPSVCERYWGSANDTEAVPRDLDQGN